MIPHTPSPVLEFLARFGRYLCKKSRDYHTIRDCSLLPLNSLKPENTRTGEKEEEMECRAGRTSAHEEARGQASKQSKAAACTRERASKQSKGSGTKKDSVYN